MSVHSTNAIELNKLRKWVKIGIVLCISVYYGQIYGGWKVVEQHDSTAIEHIANTSAWCNEVLRKSTAEMRQKKKLQKQGSSAGSMDPSGIIESRWF